MFATWILVLLASAVAAVFIALAGYGSLRLLGLPRRLSILLSPAWSWGIISAAAWFTPPVSSRAGLFSWGWPLVLAWVLSSYLLAFVLRLLCARFTCLSFHCIPPGSKIGTATKTATAASVSSTSTAALPSAYSAARASSWRFSWLLFSRYGGLVLILLALTAGPIFWGMKDATWPDQNWDAVFHLALTRDIYQTGNANPWHLSPAAFGPGAHPAYYPDSIHALASLLAPILLFFGHLLRLPTLTNFVSDIGAAWPVLSLNALMIVILLFWVFGWLAAGHTLGRYWQVRNKQAPVPVALAVTCALVASCVLATPLLQIETLAQWPFTASLTLLPYILAGYTEIQLLKMRPLFVARVRSYLALIGAGAAMTSVHPSGFFAILVLLLAGLLVWATPNSLPGSTEYSGVSSLVENADVSKLVENSSASRKPTKLQKIRARRLALVALGLAVALLCIYIAIKFIPTLAVVFGYTRKVRSVGVGVAAQALLDWPLIGHLNWFSFTGVILTLLAIWGYKGMGRPRDKIARFCASLAILGLLLVIIAAGHSGILKHLTDPWYEQAARVVVFYWVGAIPLAGYGWVRLNRFLATKIRHRARAKGVSPGYSRHVMFLLMMLLLVICSRPWTRAQITAQAHQPGRIEWGTLTTYAEMDFQASIKNYLETAGNTSSLVVSDPFNGSVYLYSIFNIGLVYPHFGSLTSSQLQTEILNNIDAFAADAPLQQRMCAANIRYAYVDRTPIWDPNINQVRELTASRETTSQLATIKAHIPAQKLAKQAFLARAASYEPHLHNLGDALAAAAKKGKAQLLLTNGVQEFWALNVCNK